MKKFLAALVLGLCAVAHAAAPTFTLNVSGITMLTPVNFTLKQMFKTPQCNSAVTNDQTGYTVAWLYCIVPASMSQLPPMAVIPPGTLGGPTFNFKISGGTLTTPQTMSFGGTTPCGTMNFTDNSGYRVYLYTCAWPTALKQH